MRNRLLGLLATTAIVFAACQGAQSTPSASTAPASAAATGIRRAVSATPAPTPVDYDQLLYGYKYEPSAGTPGGKVIISDWQAANQLNPYFSNAFANSEVFAATMAHAARGRPATATTSRTCRPSRSPTRTTCKEDTDGKGGFTVHVKIKPNLKWSDGEPFTLNDMDYTWTSVLDKAQAGISTLSWEEGRQDRRLGRRPRGRRPLQGALRRLARTGRQQQRSCPSTT